MWLNLWCTTPCPTIYLMVEVKEFYLKIELYLKTSENMIFTQIVIHIKLQQRKGGGGAIRSGARLSPGDHDQHVRHIRPGYKIWFH